jgi:hypothetical protein
MSPTAESEPITCPPAGRLQRRLPSLAAREAWLILTERDDFATTQAVLRGELFPEQPDEIEPRVQEPEPEPVQLKPLPKREGRSVAMLRAMLNADDEL